MNGLEIVVLGVLILSCFAGYRAGFLRVIYSLFSWILVLAFVTWATPYLTEFLEENTTLQTTIQEKCVVYMEKKAEEKIDQQTESVGKERQETLPDNAIWIPEDIMEEITGSTAGIMNDILEESGVYEEIASAITHFIIKGIAFFVAFIIAGILVSWVSKGLNVVSHLPMLRGVNRFFGAIVGGIKGLFYIWLAFYIITICGASQQGALLLTYIRESTILSYLYDNNILLKVIMFFL